MDELLYNALRSAQIDPASVSILEAVLLRGSNQLTVAIESAGALSPDQIECVRAAFEQALPGFRLNLDCKRINVPEPEGARAEALNPFPPAASDAADAARNPSPPAAPNAAERRAEPPQAAAGPSAFVKAEKPPVDPSCRVLLGKRIKEGKLTPISALSEGEGSVTVLGRIVSFGAVEAFAGKKNGGKSVFRAQVIVTDESDSIQCGCAFFSEGKRTAFLNALSDAKAAGSALMARGVCKTGKFSRELQIYADDINIRPGVRREDGCQLGKRVELHLHTRMSTMDALTDVYSAFAAAKRFGHKALAITDHGVVQAFPDAAKAADQTGVKAIFGVEGYLLPDTELIDKEQTYVVFDIETTGLKKEACEIIELGAVKISGGKIVARFSTFIDNGLIIPPEITALTRISTDMLSGAPGLRQALTDFSAFAEGCVLVAHNASFDVGFLRFHGARFSLPFAMPYADTLMLARYLITGLPNYKLETVCGHLHVDISGHHRAVDDAEATAAVFLHLLSLLSAQHIATIPVHTEPDAPEAQRHKKQNVNHMILLARTQQGMKNLYRLVSHAHLDHFRARPLIPKSLLSIYREGLLLGSACEQGELFQAVLAGEPEERLLAIAGSYDYLEVQPLGNNRFLLREGKVENDDALIAINKKIIALADQLGKPVVATGDVHFLEPEDAIYRKILLCKLGFADAEQQAPLYFHTTDDMLEEFSYLDEETRRRIVIDAPNQIADLCEELKPFPDGTHAPVIENAEAMLTELALSTAHDIYGDPLPQIVRQRLDKELSSIIGNGFASLYLMAQRLVQKSLSDGYLVGSRGSVGSSFVATMAGITEVNPLQPHYICPRCKRSDFDVDRAEYACGVDMPDKLCPDCGETYGKAGFDIPFEVFLGFKGDKTPDIDLNFSGEYQPIAHKYVEEMFGAGHAFRAGTISGLAERKAYECVLNYAETSGKTFRKAEIERLIQGCLNVKVTTGQHPGGIVIVPKNEDILDFTPIQYPADKKDKNTITTHFDFHSMDDRLVKLDILGHDDPTALRMLEDLTGVNPRAIPLDDPDTMGIYSSAAPLSIDLSGLSCSVGTLGVPEFGTGFVRTVLESTRPRQMEELIRIAGLTHGTDVWLNNAEPLVTNRVARLNEVLCTRDDIMNYLIFRGMDASLSFQIMERVRRGRGLTPEMERALIAGDIPAWFIDSCKKIKYMFPRGHAVAYAMMSFRVAYYKVHYPIEFYAVYFTVRADAFDITLAMGGAEAALAAVKAIEKAAQFKDFAERKRDRELQTILEVVYEMNLRGIELLPVDIYRSQGTKFTVEGNAIRPPFNAIPGVGDAAAEGMTFHDGDRPYLSVEDFQARTGANSGIISVMEKCGCFGALPSRNQISLF